MNQHIFKQDRPNLIAQVLQFTLHLPV